MTKWHFICPRCGTRFTNRNIETWEENGSFWTKCPSCKSDIDLGGLDVR